MAKKIVLSFLYLSVSVLFSCDEDEDTRSGYYTVDGVKHKVEFLYMFLGRAEQISPGIAYYETEIVFEAPGMLSAAITVASPRQILASGTYFFENDKTKPLVLMDVIECSARLENGDDIRVNRSALQGPTSMGEVTFIVKEGK